MSVIRLAADTGGGNIDILLPDTDSSMKVVAKTGAGNVTILLPDGIKARLHASSGLGKIILPPQFKKTGDKTYQCDGYEEFACKVEIEATSGAGNVIVNTIGKMSERQGSEMTRSVPARGGGVRDWQRWAPYAAVAWSLVYAALGVYWAVSGRGFPYAPETVSDVMGPVVGRFGPGVAWIVVMMAGIPAAAVGAAMLRGVRSRALRPLFITAGALLAGVLLLLMTDLNLLIMLGYIPLWHRRALHRRRVRPGLPGGFDPVDDGAPVAVSHRRVPLAGGYRQLRPPERGRLPVLRPPRRPGRVDEPRQRRALGPDRRVRGDGGASLLRPHPLRLGAGHPAGDERGVPAPRAGEWDVDLGALPGDLRPGGSRPHARPGAALGRGVPALDDRPGRAPGAHRAGGGPGLDRVGAAHGGRHHDLVRLTPRWPMRRRPVGRDMGSSLAPPCCSRSGAWRSLWRRWVTTTGGAARAECVVVAHPAKLVSRWPATSARWTPACDRVNDTARSCG